MDRKPAVDDVVPHTSVPSQKTGTPTMPTKTRIRATLSLF